ncbi:MAG: heme ABC exporter ATP-binding protein CcmA [Rubrimonas sp.]|uniref:heme ABC exporter ATP-binding protein CcmA n=1 Tax=Rubrimonas sp. TaxID=2036015 RepID=UPI002FDD9D95
MELTVENLSCRRAGRRVFAGLSFRLRSGEAALLKGPNGSGKSSLLRVLAGLVGVEGGSVRLGDVSLTGDRESFQERVAYAGHLDAVKPQFSVRDNLAAWAALYGADEVRVGPALERFGLGRIADFPAAFCSAGQKRRLGLARLMVLDRPLWLLDEPTVSLDVASTAIFADLVRAHVAAGGLAIAATHVALGLEGGPEIGLGGPPAPDAPAPPPDHDEFLAGDWR